MELFLSSPLPISSILFQNNKLDNIPIDSPITPHVCNNNKNIISFTDSNWINQPCDLVSHNRLHIIGKGASKIDPENQSVFSRQI